MKRAFTLAAAAAVLCSCASKNQFVIEGNVAGTNDVVYLLDTIRQRSRTAHSASRA